MTSQIAKIIRSKSININPTLSGRIDMKSMLIRGSLLSAISLNSTNEWHNILHAVENLHLTHGWPSTQPGSLLTALQRKYTQPCSLFFQDCVNNGGTAVWTIGHGCVQVPGCVEGHPWHWGRDKMADIFRRHFKMHFLVWKYMNLD